MVILIDINHPAHVHFFKNLFWKLKGEGHQLIVVASDKDITFTLLKNYGIPFINIGSYGRGILSKFLNLIVLDIKMFFILLKFKPDFVLGINTIRGAHAGMFFKKTKVYVFTDTEHAKEQIILYEYVADKIFTPSCFMDNLGKKQVRYNSYHDLAYLHPNNFKANKRVLDEFGLNISDAFYIIRFVSWDATHDIGLKGLTYSDKEDIVNLLKNRGRVLITSEGDLPENLKKYQIKVSPEKIHHLLYFSQMYVGEGGTMATESAVLGTPSLLISSLYAGVFKELENKYHLLRRVSNSKKATQIIGEWLSEFNLKQYWIENRQRMLEDKVDFNMWFIKYLEHSLNNK